MGSHHKGIQLKSMAVQVKNPSVSPSLVIYQSRRHNHRSKKQRLMIRRSRIRSGRSSLHVNT